MSFEEKLREEINKQKSNNQIKWEIKVKISRALTSRLKAGRKDLKIKTFYNSTESETILNIINGGF
jgi:hypothetical protein